jgi:hypothetical protein
MKILLKIIFLFIFICVCVVPTAAGEDVPGTVKITYVLHWLETRGSNQIAVWIEDESGNYVKTLYATSFAANGGFKIRTQTLPEWIKASDWENASSTDIDAMSGATQPAGAQEVVWDLKDMGGNNVAGGTYVYKIEGNIFQDNRVLWQGSIDVSGEKNSSQAEATYFPENTTEERVLVEQVRAVYEP